MVACSPGFSTLSNNDWCNDTSDGFPYPGYYSYTDSYDSYLDNIIVNRIDGSKEAIATKMKNNIGHIIPKALQKFKNNRQRIKRAFRG